MFGKVAGIEAAKFAKAVAPGNTASLLKKAADSGRQAEQLVTRSNGTERIATLRERNGADHGRWLRHLSFGRHYASHLHKSTNSSSASRTSMSRTNPACGIPIGYWQSNWAISSMWRKRWRIRRSIARECAAGISAWMASKRVTIVNFLKHSQAHYAGDGAPRIDYGEVKITKSRPGTRAYGAAGEKAEQERKQASHV